MLARLARGRNAAIIDDNATLHGTTSFAMVRGKKANCLPLALCRGWREVLMLEPRGCLEADS